MTMAASNERDDSTSCWPEGWEYLADNMLWDDERRADVRLMQILQRSEWPNIKDNPAIFGHVVKILTRFPSLASRTYGWDRIRNRPLNEVQLFPLSLIVMSERQATLDIVRKIYHLYPPAVDSAGTQYINEAQLARSTFPLSQALLSDRKDDTIVNFLAQNLDEKMEENGHHIRALMMHFICNKPARKLSMVTINLLLDNYPCLASFRGDAGETILDFDFHGDKLVHR